MGAVSLTIPFMLLSTRVVFETEIEKRYLTPFGIVDLIFRSRGVGEKQKSHLVVEAGGDDEDCVSCDAHIETPATSLLSVVWDMAKGHLTEGIRSALNEVSIDIKGYEMDLKAPWWNRFLGEWETLTENRPTANGPP